MFMVIFSAVTHIALQLIGFLGTNNLWSIPHIATNALHPGQVLLVENLEERKKANIYVYNTGKNA